MGNLRLAVAVCVLSCVPLLHAGGVWTYVDAEGTTHIGNAPPPRVKQIEWLGFDERIRSVGRSAGGSVNPLRFRGYESVKPVLESAAERHALDPALVKAVAAAESAFRPDAVSHKGAVGLMQVMPATAARYGVKARDIQQATAILKDPELNAQVGTRYLADLIRMFEGNLELAIAAYNAGEGAVLRHGRRIPPYPETQQYVARVMRFYRTLSGYTG